MVQEPLESLVQFGPSIEVKTGCSELAAAVSPEWLNSLPVIPQHGDLYSGNVLSNRKRFYIVDWENFGAVDLPFYDLLTLLYSLFRGTEQGPATRFPPKANNFQHSSGITPEIEAQSCRCSSAASPGSDQLVSFAFKGRTPGLYREYVPNHSAVFQGPGYLEPGFSSARIDSRG